MGALLSAWTVARLFFGQILAFVSKPPGSYIAIILACAIGLWWFGQHEFNRGRAACQAESVAAGVHIVPLQARINVSIGNIVAGKITLIEQNRSRLEGEIATHVTPYDPQYPVSLGFVRVWQDASHNPVPGPAAGGDADPSGVTQSDVARAHVGTEAILDTCRAYNDAWWSWYDQQRALFGGRE
jgi:hypothetical protein